MLRNDANVLPRPEKGTTATAIAQSPAPSTPAAANGGAPPLPAAPAVPAVPEIPGVPAAPPVTGARIDRRLPPRAMTTLLKPLQTRPRGRRGRRRDTEPTGRTLLKAAATLAVLGALGWLGLTLVSGVPGKSYRTIYVESEQTGNLIPHDPVRISGVRVGQVTGRSTTPDGLARITLQLDGDTKLTKDTSVTFRANGLLGARFVELRPGKSRQLLADSATIQAGENALTFGVPEALDTLDSPTRKQLGNMLDGLGIGLFGNGRRLNAAVHATGTHVDRLNETIETVVDERPGALARLAPSLESAVRPFDAERTTIADGLAPTTRGCGRSATAASRCRRRSTPLPPHWTRPTPDWATAGACSRRRARCRRSSTARCRPLRPGCARPPRCSRRRARRSARTRPAAGGPPDPAGPGARHERPARRCCPGSTTRSAS